MIKKLTILEEFNGGANSIWYCQALYYPSSGMERRGWIHNHIPFFDPMTSSLWEIYCRINPSFDHDLEVDERSRFLRRPYFLAIRNEHFVGGVWEDNTEYNRKKRIRSVDFHILVKPEFRAQGIGSLLLDTFENVRSGVYDIAASRFFEGEVHKDCREFLIKRGYDVREVTEKNKITYVARKRLR